ncbi:MAG: hypothetical protein ACYC9S_10505 [Leptospirales bacterium]
MIPIPPVTLLYDGEGVAEESKMAHEVYMAIITAVREERIQEPFTAANVRRGCPEINPTTPGTFLPKHAEGNPRRNSELFEKVARGLFRLLRPIKNGLCGIRCQEKSGSLEAGDKRTDKHISPGAFLYSRLSIV